MKKFALIGSGISHSLSPALFRAAYKESPFTYSLIDCNSIDEALDHFFSGNFEGANVTSPFKEDIIKYCKFSDLSVSEIGAANLILNHNGALHCFNTDYMGVMDSVLSTGDKFESAILIGAGGAAKAAAYALKKLNIRFITANRTAESAQMIANQYNEEWIRLESIREILDSNKLIIYTIDHLIPYLDGYDFSRHTIFEANYKSPHFSEKICKKYISGREWLVCQAVPSFRLFTNSEPDLKAMNLVKDNR